MSRHAVTTSHSGFTLIELMISIAIVGILASISMPNYLSYRDRAYYAEMVVTLKYLMDGQDIYMAEHNTYFPVSGSLSIPEGTAMDIPELGYRFGEGHRNRYTIQTADYNAGFFQLAYCLITVRTRFDINHNGRDDVFNFYSLDLEYGGSDIHYSRRLVQLQ